MYIPLPKRTDSYKASHPWLYPPGTVGMSMYLESRGGLYDETVFFGLQYILHQYLSGPVVDALDVKEAEDFFTKHGLPFPTDGWMKIVQKHGGRIPVRIRAIKEGTVVPVRNALLTIESTDPEVFWIVGWLEALLHRVWYPTTVATQSREAKKVILEYLKITSDDPYGQIPFKLHDFGGRGVSSAESAEIGGAAHLVNFMGSDTVEGIEMANSVYNAGMAGFSIPASEHSTITSWGRDGELEAYRNMLQNFGKPGKIFACVSDSYDIYKAVREMWGGALKQQVIDSGAVLVVRPDSGDPVTVVNRVVHDLAREFGVTVNSKGFKVLNNVRVIQGDGVNLYTIQTILKSLKLAGFSADNIAFGMGGALLQKVDRDTQRFAMKCSAIAVETTWDGHPAVTWRDVYKDPITDPGKHSKAGLLDVIQTSRGIQTMKMPSTAPHPDSLLDTVFENGQILRMQSFEEIRALASKGL